MNKNGLRIESEDHININKNHADFSEILESHYYGLNGVAIKYTTRNICADATAKILEEIAFILFPQEEVEIYILPANEGCHQDNFWIKVKKEPVVATSILVTFIGAVLVASSNISQIMTDVSTRKLNESQLRVNNPQEELYKVQAQKLKKDLEDNNPIIKITIEQCIAIIQSQEIKRNKKNHFNQLQSDSDIEQEKFVARSEGEIISEKIIERADFDNYSEQTKIDEGYITFKAAGLIEILSPVVKQKQQGGGMKWKGIFHGEDIYYNEEKLIFTRGDNIDFYMQDDDFKSKITNHEIVFGEGDNIFVHMEIKFFLSDKKLSRKTVYIKDVERFNEDVIEHKKSVMKKTTVVDNQTSLF